MQALINRFKEFRRCKKLSTPKPSTSTTKPVKNTSKQPSPGRMLSTPDIPDGEDETSFARHNKQIKAEIAKGSRKNNVVLGSLIEQSFAMRRRDILVYSM